MSIALAIAGYGFVAAAFVFATTWHISVPPPERNIAEAMREIRDAIGLQIGEEPPKPATAGEISDEAIEPRESLLAML